MVEKVMTGIVLQKWYFEDEHIIKILTEGGNVLRLKAKGLDNIDSKNNSSLQIFNKVEVEFFTSPNNSRETGRLKRARAIKEFLGEHTDENFMYMEVIRNMIAFQEHNNRLTFSVLEQIIFKIENKIMNFQALLCLMIVTIRNNGYTPIVDRCAKCGSRLNIKGFEISEGGLICKLHEEGSKYKLPLKTLLKLIEINSLKNPMECRSLEFTQEEVESIRSTYKQFLENQLALNMYMLDRKRFIYKK